MADGCLHNATDRTASATAEERQILEDAAPDMIRRRGPSYTFSQFRNEVLADRRLGYRFDKDLADIWSSTREKMSRTDPELHAKIDWRNDGGHLDYRFFRHTTDEQGSALIADALASLVKEGRYHEIRRTGRGQQEIFDIAQKKTLEEVLSTHAVNEGLQEATQNFRNAEAKKIVDLERRIAEEEAKLGELRVHGSLEDLQAANANIDAMRIDVEASRELHRALVAREEGNASAFGRSLANLRNLANISTLGVPEAGAHQEIFSDSGPLTKKLPVDLGHSEVASVAPKESAPDAPLKDQLEAEAAAQPKRKPIEKDPPRQRKIPMRYTRASGVKTLLGAFDRIRREKGAEASRQAREEFKRLARANAKEFWLSVGMNPKGEWRTPLNKMMDQVVALGIKDFPSAYKAVRDMPALQMSTDFWVKKADGTFTRKSHYEALAEAFEAATGTKPTPAEIRAAMASTEKAREKLDNLSQNEFYDVPNRKDVLFTAPTAKVALDQLQQKDFYWVHGNNKRNPMTGDILSYLGGYTYERMYRNNDNKPVAFKDWVAQMKALTGVDISPKDYTDTWANLKDWSNRRIVEPRIDAKRKALRDASVRMTGAQTAEYEKLLSELDENDPNFGHQKQMAYDYVMNRLPKGWEILKEVNGIMRNLAFSDDMSIIMTHLPYMATDPRRWQQMYQSLKIGFAAMARPEVYDEVLSQIRNPEDERFYWRNKFMRDQLVDVHTKSNELFSSNFINRLAQMSYEGKTSSILSRAWKKPSSTVSFQLPEKFNIQTPTAIKSEKGPLGFIKTQGLNKMPVGTTVGTDTNPLAFFARSVAGSERGWNATANIVRASLFDAGFERLKAEGYDPEIHEQVFQSMADSIGIWTGIPNLRKRVNDPAKLAHWFFSAPRYAASHFQLLGRPMDMLFSAWYDAAVAAGKVPQDVRNQVEAYIPSTTPLEDTPIHATPAQSLYNSRYVPATERKQFANALGGYLSGMAFITAASILSGGEVNLDPTNDNYWTVSYGKFKFGLPGAPLSNTIRFLAQVLPFTTGFTKSDGEPQPGLVTHWTGREGARKFVPYGTGITDRKVIEKFRLFLEGRMAPMTRTAVHFGVGNNALGQKVYLRRWQTDKGEWNFDHNWDNFMGSLTDLWSDTGSLSPTDAANVLSEKDAVLAEKVLGAAAFMGVPNRPTKFKPDARFHKE